LLSNSGRKIVVNKPLRAAQIVPFVLRTAVYSVGRSRWPRDIRRGYAAARLLGLRVRIPPGAWMSLVSAVRCQVDVSATGRSILQRSPIECGVSECHLETSTIRSRSTRDVEL